MRILFQSLKELIERIVVMHKIRKSMSSAIRETTKGSLVVTSMGKALTTKIFDRSVENIGKFT